MTAPNPHGLTQLRDALRQFAAERDWDQFHSPKNLASALSVEAAELLERFQWLTEEQSRNLPPAELAQVREEMADVLNYLVRLADKLDVNLLEAAREKMEAERAEVPGGQGARQREEVLRALTALRATLPAMSTHYVLVDFENVQPDLSALAGTPYKVKIFFGAKQQESRVPFKLLDAVMALGGNAEAIKITRSGSNAVDMHIAWFIGGLLEREPHARIHIISGDSDFDPLLEFLAARGVECRRTKTIAELATRKAARPAAATPKAAAAPRRSR